MSKQKDKGTKFETLLVRDAQERGFSQVERLAMAGAEDKGDIRGFRNIAIEVKNHARLKLPEWWREAEKEMENAGKIACVVAHKRHGKGLAGDQWVTMDWDTFLWLASRAGEVERE